ncbi:Integral membrane protein [Pleurostoma richardsiae]|uniref:Integral membrane protein n=1 Tax=Pleurostoma richardsiae TaxID=41990 RepID=A0AA38VZK5_9PEZI|nr:Integral membrane protein [Pleurostoma richardsiae]
MMDRHRDHFTGRHYRAEKISGPLSFFNPTTRVLPVHRPRAGRRAASAGHPAQPAGGAPLEKEHTRSGVYHVWRSRDNRKGRHAVTVKPGAYAAAAGAAAAAAAPGAQQGRPSLSRPPRATDTLAETLRGLARMALRFPVWDVSYDVAVVFTLGSVVWVLNGFFVLLPIVAPSTNFAGESDWGGGVTALVGATVFEAGSVLLMLEAVNENREDCFGWALEEAWESWEGGGSGGGGLEDREKHGGGEGGFVLRRLEGEGGCRHHHGVRKALVRGPRRVVSEDGDGNGEGKGASGRGRDRMWSWWPSWYELRTHYFRDIGFLACLSQMIGATIFWTAGITGIPPIVNRLSVPAENGVYWLTQVVGGSGFIVSSLLFMLETQPRWYIPAPKVLGWHVGLWNLVGAIGFTLCGALGFAEDQPGMEYALSLSTFIGSWAFLIGSVIQWYESLDKYPVSVEKDGDSKSSDSSSGS